MGTDVIELIDRQTREGEREKEKKEKERRIQTKEIDKEEATVSKLIIMR